LRDAIYGDQGGGRKIAIHILEFFDRIGYTRRVRDDHLVRHEGAQHDWITT
jgi:selenocysteine-specific elongation factor